MNKALNLLGLCARAGFLVTGEAACEQAIKKGGAHLAVIDDGASNNAKESMKDACDYMDIPMVTVPKDALGQSIGKPGRMAAVVKEPKMAAQIIERINSTENNRGCI